MANKFSKALKHIKKDLNEVAPTNSMSGVYAINPPGFELGPPSPTKRFLPDVDGNFPAGVPGNPGDPYYERPAGHYVGDKDWDTITKPDFRNVRLGADGNSTEGLFDGTTVLANLPPNSRSYILGPLVDGFVYNHGHDAYTRIGYIDKASRGFVMLGYIRGQWSQNHVFESTGKYDNTNNVYGFPVWDGTTVDSSSGFHSYGSLTLADAQWMRTEILAGRYIKNTLYRASGGIGQATAPPTPDPPEGWPEGTPWPPPGWYYGGAGVGAGSGDAGSGGPGQGYGAGGDPDIGTGQGEPGKGGPEDNEIWGLTPEQWKKAQELLDAGMLAWDVAAIIGVTFGAAEPVSTAAGGARLAHRARQFYKLWQSFRGKGKSKGTGSPTGSGSGKKPTKVKNSDVPDFVNKNDGPFTKDDSGRIRNRVGDEVVRPDGTKPGPYKDSTGTSVNKSGTDSGAPKGSAYDKWWNNKYGGGSSSGGGSPSGGGSKPSGGSSSGGGSKSSNPVQQLKNWWNKGRNERVKGPDGTENTASWSDLFKDDRSQIGKSDANFEAGKAGNPFGRPDQAFNPFRPAEKGGFGSGPTPLVRQMIERGFKTLGGTPKGGILNTQIDKTVDMMSDRMMNDLKDPDTELPKMIKKFDQVRDNGVRDAIKTNNTSTLIIDIKRDPTATSADRLSDLNNVARLAKNDKSAYDKVVPELIEAGREVLQDMGTFVRNIPGVDATGDFINGVEDGIGTLRSVMGTLSDARANGQIKNGQIVSGAPGSTTNPIQNTVQDSTAEDIIAGIDWTKELGPQIQDNVSKDPISGNIGAKGIHNNLPSKGRSFTGDYPAPHINKNGDLIIPDTYAFRPHGYEHMPQVKAWGRVAKFFGQNEQEAIKDAATVLDQSVGSFVRPFGVNIPGRKDPIVHFNTVIPKAQLDKFRGTSSKIGNQSSISGKKDTQIAQANKPMPDYVKDSIKRQYKGGKDYKLEDMKNVINWHQKAHYEPQGKVLSESTRRQLREIKKPVEVREEAPKKLKGYRPNFKGRNRPQNTPDITASKKSDELVKATNTLGQAWRTSDKEFKTFESQSTLNLIRDAHGHGDLAWQQIIHDSAQKNGWRNREIQEQLNKVAHLKAMREQVGMDYENPFVIQETEQSEREKNFDRVTNIKSIVGNKLSRKDIKPEYPEEGPPELGPDGFHPKLGKDKFNYYKRLDSVSARAMPKTGDPEIDATVDKQKKKKMVQPKVAEDTRSNWRDSLERSNVEEKQNLNESLFKKISQYKENKEVIQEKMANTTSGVFSYTLDGSYEDLHTMQSGFDGESITALTSFTDIALVNDPHDMGTNIRNNQDPNLVPTNSDANHTAYTTSSGLEGDSGGFRGINWSNTSTVTNENQPVDTSISGGETEGEYMSNRVGAHLSWGSPGNPGYPRFAALKAVDTTLFDSISINWFTRGLISQDLAPGSETYGQYVTRDDTDFTEPGDGIYLFYWAGDKEGAKQYAGDLNAQTKDHDGWRPVNVKPDGTTDSGYSPLLIPHKAEGYKGNRFFKNDLELPPWTRDKNTRFIIVQIDNHTGIHKSRWGMTSVRFQRRTPKQVFAALDTPESISFVRVGSKEGDPRKRRKAVEDQLKASKQYTDTVIGKDFPGSGATLSDTEASPIGKEEVKKKFSA